MERRMQVIEFLLVLQKRRFVGRFVRQIMMLIGVDVPRTVTIGRGLRVYHRGYGLVVHPKTIIGDNVRLYHGVTIGRADPHTGVREPENMVFMIEDDVWLCVGSVVLGKGSGIRVGRGTILAANSVLISDTGEGEIWSGVPARMVGRRRDFGENLDRQP